MMLAVNRITIYTSPRAKFIVTIANSELHFRVYYSIMLRWNRSVLYFKPVVFWYCVLAYGKPAKKMIKFNLLDLFVQLDVHLLQNMRPNPGMNAFTEFVIL